MSKKKDGSAIKAEKRRKQKKLRYQAELQRRKDQRSRHMTEGYRKPSDAVTDYVNQCLEVTKWATFMKSLVSKQLEEMKQRYELDKVRYKNMPFAPWLELKNRIEKCAKNTASIMEIAGKISNATSEGDKLILMSEGITLLADAHLETKTLAAATETLHNKYKEYIEHPEAEPEVMDLPDDIFEPVEDENVSGIKDMANEVSKMVTTIQDTTFTLEKVTDKLTEPSEEQPVENTVEVPEALKF